MIEITRWPVVILANYRTGSSVLCRKLALDNNVPAFIEPAVTEQRQKEFLDNILDKFVIKFMPDQVASFAPYQQLLDADTFKIKLKRKDKAEQIASHYIAKVRDKWWTTIDDAEKDYFLAVDNEKLEESIEHILKVDTMLDQFVGFEAELFFEDLGYIDDVDRKPALKPKNMSRLLDIIKKKL